MLPMNEDFKINTEPIVAKLSFVGGHWEDVFIYLPEEEGFRSSRLRRLLAFFRDDSGPFLAVRRQAGGDNVLIIRKSLIRWVELKGTDWLEDEDRAGLACPVGVSFPSGDKIKGTIYNDLPTHQQRVLDFMNQPELYFLLEAADKVYLINREATSRVDDPPLG